MATYYVDENGSDGDAGDSENPFATLHHACSVASSGDTIHVNAGTISETQNSWLPEGVDLEGPTVAGNPTAIIRATTSFDYMLRVESGSISSAGNDISYIYFDGNGYKVSELVRVTNRHNVKVHNCYFDEADDTGLLLVGHRTGDGTGTWATGCEIYSNTFYDCAHWQGSWHSGNIHVGYLTGAKIYGNTINSTVRESHGIKLAYEGHFKACEFYDNEIHVHEQGYGNGNVFSIELWEVQDGCKVYNNTIDGAMNIDQASYGAGYNFACDIYNNDFVYDTQATVDGSYNLTFDGPNDGIIIRDNYFSGASRGIGFYFRTGSIVMSNFKIYRNVFYNLGTSSAYGKVIGIAWADSSWSLNNLYFWNNVVDGGGTSQGMWNALSFDGTAGMTSSGMEITNNIFVNCSNVYAGWFGGGSWGGVIIKNNDRYNNGNSNNYDNTGGYASITAADNNTNNPGYNASGDRPSPYYRPTGSGSNLVDAGLDVGLTYKGSAPDIGAYEYTPPGGGFSDYLENALLDHALKNSAYTAPTNIYVALYTAAPTDAGGGTECSGGAYARVNHNSWNAAVSGVVTNSGAVTFPVATAAWGSIVAAGLLDASAAGNLLMWDTLTSSKTISTGDKFVFAAGEISVTLT